MHEKRGITQAFSAGKAVLSAFFLAEYLNLPAWSAGATVLLVLLILCGGKDAGEREYTPAHRALIWGFSLVFTISLILGKHLHVEDGYSGLLTDNYITPYSVRDGFAAVFLTLGVRTMLLGLLRLLRGKEAARSLEERQPSGGGVKTFLAVFAFLLLAWLPYLLYYSPGFVFTDSVNSIQQALGQIPLNNRNPVLFTLFIRFCLFCGGAFVTKDLTAGCFLFSILQMLYMGAGLSYMICWISRRGRLPVIWTCALAAVYGLTPYIGASSIAMWKDPAFSVTLVLWTLLLADFALSDGAVIGQKGWLLKAALCLLMLLFWRNNGICAVLGLLAALAIGALRRRKKGDWPPAFRRLLLLTGAGVLLWGLVFVPGYKLAGFGTPKEESAGLMLNQMARVAAYRGEMSDEERDYLDEIVPFEMYPSLYRPCCVDMLKWDEHFQYSALGGSRFVKTWASLMVKNPRLAFEAWELETYGFWTVNRPEICRKTDNIFNGSAVTQTDHTMHLGDYSLRMERKLKGEVWERLLLKDEWAVPVGWMNWLVALAALCLILTGRARGVLALAPSFGLAVGLALGTPIYYLARYEAGVQFLLPVFILMLFPHREQKASDPVPQ